MSKSEYRVRPVVRYIVTMHNECATSVIGEFDNEFYADCVAGAMRLYDQDPVAYEFLHANGHAIVDYSEHTHVGHLSADQGYKKRPLIYGPPPQEIAGQSNL
jgi:hypothetical protein